MQPGNFSGHEFFSFSYLMGSKLTSALAVLAKLPSVPELKNNTPHDKLKKTVIREPV